MSHSSHDSHLQELLGLRLECEARLLCTSDPASQRILRMTLRHIHYQIELATMPRFLHPAHGAAE